MAVLVTAPNSSDRQRDRDRRAMKTILWILAVTFSAVAGFYFGIGQGAKTIGTIAAQNEVSDAVSTLHISLKAIAKNDIASANDAHDIFVRGALIKLGSYASSVPFWKCSGRDREAMAAARSYEAIHPSGTNDPLHRLIAKGLAFCSGAPTPSAERVNDSSKPTPL